MRDPLSRLYRIKMLLVCILLVLAGSAFIAAGRHLPEVGQWRWIGLLPWSELGGILVGAGLLSVWIDGLFRREQGAIDERRLRHLLHEQAPAMRDAVLDGFAANQDDLARVATPELLDRLIQNSLTMRLHDEQFASEIYNDVRDQAIGASERWYDASVSIDVSPSTRKVGSGRARPGSEYLIVTVRWEYTTVPGHTQRRFVCVSDRQEYAELASERGSTSAWYFKPDEGIDPESTEAFELLQFSVDGKARPIRRAVRKAGQQYNVDIGSANRRVGSPIKVSYTYRTITRASGHLLFVEIEQPTRDLKFTFDYGACSMSSVSVLDLVPSVRQRHIEYTPEGVSQRAVRVDVEGWTFPRSGIAVVWTLQDEVRSMSAVRGAALRS